MRSLRVLSIVSLLIAGMAGSAMAQRVNTPGKYSVKICVAPGLLPDGGASLPHALQGVDPQVYEGELIVSRVDGNYRAWFQGNRSDGAMLIAAGIFDSDWAGFLLGSIPVGSVSESDCITGIDVANLLDGRIIGVGSFEGTDKRLIALLGEGGAFKRFRLVPAPAIFR